MWKITELENRDKPLADDYMMISNETDATNGRSYKVPIGVILDDMEEYIDDNVEDLQTQIDAIVSKKDVKDIVGTYQELLNYDTSKLENGDVVKVITDETHDDTTSYYRWTSSSWEYIGSEKPIDDVATKTWVVNQGYQNASQVDEKIATAIGNAIGGGY